MVDKCRAHGRETPINWNSPVIDSDLRTSTSLSFIVFPQILDYEAGNLVHEPFCLFAGENFWAAQNCSMGQCLHGCYADKGCNIEISNINIIAMGIEIA